MCEHECGHGEMIRLWFCPGLCESVGGRSTTLFMLWCICVQVRWSTRVGVCALLFFPQAAARVAAAEPLVTYPARVSE